MNGVFLCVRFVLAFLCACAFLFALSFPHSIVPPNPALEGFAPSWSLYGLKGYLFVLPLLLWELVCVAGPRRNLVWFSSLLSLLVVVLLAWPLLDAWYPELLWQTFSYEDGRLSYGVGCLAVLLVFSMFFRLLILNYFFALPAEPYEGNDVGLMELDISKAQTVQTIAAQQRKVVARFQFGGPDRGLIARFYARARALLRMRRLYQLCIAAAVLAGLAWFFVSPAFLSSPQQALERDWARMYDFEQKGLKAPLATTPAVYAAYRVFERLSADEALAGMSMAEADALMRVDTVPAQYKTVLCDDSDLTMGAAEDIFASRTRYLTVTDGTRRVVLYVRMNGDATRINICEVQDDGWNLVVDKERQRLGAGWRSKVISR